MRPPLRLVVTLTVVALLIGVITPTQLGGWLRTGWTWAWHAAAGVAAGWGA